MNLNASRTFQTEAVKVEATVDNGADQPRELTGGPDTLTIHYDHAAGTYRLSATTGDQTFAPGDRTTASSQGLADYQKTTGAINERLTLTIPSDQPPGNGYSVTAYVGGGRYVRTEEFEASKDIRTSFFTFGMPTAQSDLPRTGVATYNVHLLGIIPYFGEGPPLGGSGRISADFGRSRLNASGTWDLPGPPLPRPHWQATATLSADGSFTGDFYLTDHKGSWHGGFYGPGAVEIGAVFEAPGLFSGFMTGSSIPAMAPYDLDMLRPERNLGYGGIFAESRIAPAESGFSLSPLDPRTGPVTYYSKNDLTGELKQYLLRPGGFDGASFSAEHLVSARSDERFDVYERQGPNGAEQLHLSVPGHGNPDIQLTYLRFGHWQRNLGDGTSTVARDYFMFGFSSLAHDVPIRGTASYSGSIYGQAGAKEGGKLYDLGGTASFLFDFGTSVFSGSMSPVGTSSGSDQQVDFGTFSFGNTHRFGREFRGRVIDGSGDVVGNLLGSLFGPGAVEIGAGFNIALPDSAASGAGVSMGGVIVGRQQ